MNIEKFLEDKELIKNIFRDAGVKPEHIDKLDEIIKELSNRPENMDLYEDDPTRTKGAIIAEIAFMIDQKIIAAMDDSAAAAAAAAALAAARRADTARSNAAARAGDMGMDGGRRRNTFRRRMRKRRTRRG